MNNILNKILYSIFLIILTVSCAKNVNVKKKGERVKEYSISLFEFGTLLETRNMKDQLSGIIMDGLVIQKVNENKYRLLLGEYETSYAAGKKAFNLFKNQIINKFDIVHNRRIITDSYNNVLYISKYFGRNSLYRYNLITKNIENVWTKPLHSVLTLNRNSFSDVHFFTTARKTGMREGFPFIEDTKVWLISTETDDPQTVAEFGECSQLYSFWENIDTFKVNISNPDSVDASLVVQYLYSFDIRGKLSLANKRSYNLIKEGFPLPPAKRFQLLSPNNQYEIEMNKNGELNLKDYNFRSVQNIYKSDKSLTDLIWSDDGNYLIAVFEVKLNQSDVSSEIIVFEGASRKIISTHTGRAIKNMFVQGELIFYDEIKEGVSSIVIYDYIKNELFSKIESAGGSSLNNLPY
ncbi:MAG: hypothetical protein KF816_11975 [Melioribacteraceae bacterium]|nr:hypothetical protein [Melioribacteraceae bacterium]